MSHDPIAHYVAAYSYQFRIPHASTLREKALADSRHRLMHALMLPDKLLARDEISMS